MFTPRSSNSVSDMKQLSDRGRIVTRGDFERNDETERQRLEEDFTNLILLPCYRWNRCVIAPGAPVRTVS